MADKTHYILEGVEADDLAGRAVSSAGDVNGDGLDDLLIGAYQADPYGTNSGEAYLIFSNQLDNADVNSGSGGAVADGLVGLAGLDGTYGYVFEGTGAHHNTGFSVSSAGDVDNDGLDDLIIGAYQVGPNGNFIAGESYVVLGSKLNELDSIGGSGGAVVDGKISLSDLDGVRGYTLQGIEYNDHSGYSVSSAGDVDGDGKDDLLVGAFENGDPNGNLDAGETYLIYGGQLADLDSVGGSGGAVSDGNIDLADLNGTTGFVFEGLSDGDKSGLSVSSAGDLDGDGQADLVIGSGADSGTGVADAYVIYGDKLTDLDSIGGSGGAVSDGKISLADLNGSTGFVLEGVVDGSSSAQLNVSSAGDVDGDGQGDLIVGAHLANAGGFDNGRSYLIFGDKLADLDSVGGSGGAVTDGKIDLADLDGTNGYIFEGDDPYDTSGFAVSSAGDVDGDGKDDLLIGAHQADPNGNSSGEAYLIYGGQLSNLDSVGGSGGAVADGKISLADLDGTTGYVFEGDSAADLLGVSVSSAGDVDGDGKADLLIGASGIGDTAGESYVVFGSQLADLDAAGGSGGAVTDGKIDLSNPTDSSGPVNSAATGYFTVNGTQTSEVAEGQTLQVNLVDPDGLTTSSPTYIWESSMDNGASWSVIPGASGDSYTVGFDEAGNDIRVSTSFTDDNSNLESVTLQLSTPVIAVNTAATNGYILEGIDAADASGFSVSSAGDVDGDGLSDLIVGARFASPGGDLKAGESYLVFGSQLAALDAEGGSGGAVVDGRIDLSDLDGTSGYIFEGITANDSSGFSVSSVGDIDNDGLDDLLIGAFGANPSGNNSGESYLVFGSELSNLDAIGGSGGAISDGFIDLADLDGSRGYTFEGIDGSDYSGFSVSSAGDADGDGTFDILIGAEFADPSGNNSGETYLIFGDQLANLDAVGGSGGGVADGNISLSDLDGTTGYIIEGISSNDESGRSVSSAGDVDGDGIADLLIGAHLGDPGGVNNAGESYLLYGAQLESLDKANSGSGSETDGRISLTDLDGNHGYIIEGIADSDVSGVSVSSAGDVDGDGKDDLIVGATGTDPNGFDSGSSYLIFGDQLAQLDASGGSDGAVADGLISLSNLNGPQGYTFEGIDAGDASGVSVSSAGDVNGDGKDDLIVGARSADVNGMQDVGESYLIYGGQLAALDAVGGGNGALVDGNISLSDLNGTHGYILEGVSTNDRSGESVSSAGDVDGDGLDDLIIGAQNAGHSGAQTSGESYVVFGSQLADLDAAGGSGGAVTDGKIDLSNPMGLVVPANQPASGHFTVNGTQTSEVAEGQTLQVNLVDPDGLTTSSPTYIWESSTDNGANWTAIPGASGDSYTVGFDEAGSDIRVSTSFTDDIGSAENVVLETTLITDDDQLPTGNVTISGSPTEGLTLTADISAISDPDGLGTFSYQWQKFDGTDWVDVANATDATFELGFEMAGEQYRVETTFDDTDGHNYTQYSDAVTVID
ncbi:beta strand repeat-containing protein, partial [Rhodovibrionaceae bacterium A322]